MSFCACCWLCSAASSASVPAVATCAAQGRVKLRLSSAQARAGGSLIIAAEQFNDIPCRGSGLGVTWDGHALAGRQTSLAEQLDLCVTIEHTNDVYTVAMAETSRLADHHLQGTQRLLSSFILCRTDRIHDDPCRLSLPAFQADLSNGSQLLPLQQLAFPT